jgi:hypothetical protein
MTNWSGLLYNPQSVSRLLQDPHRSAHAENPSPRFLRACLTRIFHAGRATSSASTTAGTGRVRACNGVMPAEEGMTAK